MVSHCGVNLIFMTNDEYQHVLIGHFIFFCEVSLQIFCQYFNWGACLLTDMYYKYFLPVWCLNFISLKVSSKEKKMLKSFSPVCFSLMGAGFALLSKKSLSIPRHKILSYVSSRSVILERKS